jgi:hypothetical protein
MAATIEVKKGGPYTKKEQEERRKEVYRLHFELGYSAVKIADLLKFNRNTINTDIDFLYSQLAEQWNMYDTNSLIIKQVQRLELQRSRLLEELDKQEESSDKIIIEKLLFEIDNRITHIYSKFLPPMRFQPSPDIEVTYDDVKNFVRRLIKRRRADRASLHCKTHDLNFEVMRLTKCGPSYADAMYNKMYGLGLDICKNNDDLSSSIYPVYDILKFAEMRGFLSEKEIYQEKSKIT